jgi:phosphoglycerate dehydrogenase-like enzyme
MEKIKALFTRRTTPDVYAAFHEVLPKNVELVTRETDDEAEELAKAKDCDVIIQGTMWLSQKLVDAAPKLKLVIHLGVGYQDTVDLDALRKRHIRLAVTPAGTVLAVAEHTVMFILGLERQLIEMDRSVREDRFAAHLRRVPVRGIAGKTIGYVGMGRIGQLVAPRMKALETQGLYYDPAWPLSEGKDKEYGLTRGSLDDVLSKADIVTLHVPNTPETYHMIDAKAFAKMRQGTTLINTARGPVVEENALMDALRSGRVRAAALDVFEKEPLRADHPLTKFPNVILTPHVAGLSDAGIDKRAASIAENLKHYLAGQPLNDEVKL